jgi:nucleoside-triphosphatase THEP1
MPVVNGKRSFYNPYMDVNVLAEAPKDKLASELIFEVGKFKFSKKSFKIAASWLKMKPPLNTDYLVVDEIGPLELRAEGLEPEFSEFIERVKNGEINQTVILVVRKTLTNQVLKHYKLDSVRVIQKEELEHI